LEGLRTFSPIKVCKAQYSEGSEPIVSSWETKHQTVQNGVHRRNIGGRLELTVNVRRGIFRNCLHATYLRARRSGIGAAPVARAAPHMILKTVHFGVHRRTVFPAGMMRAWCDARILVLGWGGQIVF
jgi:hypothetical protein